MSTGGATTATGSGTCSAVAAGLWIKIHGWSSSDPDASGGGNVIDGYHNPSGGSTDPIPTAANSEFCPRGKTCVAGVASNCPQGSFCGDYKLVNTDKTINLKINDADPDLNLVVTGKCTAGHWCEEGATSPVPVTNTGTTAQGLGGLCDHGYWCEEGTAKLGYVSGGGANDPTPPAACPAGTYGAGVGLRSEAECTPCPHGFVCATEHLTDFRVAACPVCECPAGQHCPTADGAAKG